jgi:ABC-type sugar transport system permease subunit
MAGSLVLAAVVERSGKKARTVFRTLFFLPVIASLAVTGLVWAMLLNPVGGHVNLILGMLGVTAPNWLNEPGWAMASLVMVGIWRGVSYNLILYIAGIQGIDAQYYEAARIDGAGAVGQFFHITVPLLSHVNLFVLVVSVIQSFQVFATVNIMTKGGPNNATNVLVYQVYQEAFQFFDIGRSSAAAIVMLILVLAVAVAQIRMIDRSETSKAR